MSHGTGATNGASARDMWGNARASASKGFGDMQLVVPRPKKSNELLHVALSVYVYCVLHVCLVALGVCIGGATKESLCRLASITGAPLGTEEAQTFVRAQTGYEHLTQSQMQKAGVRKAQTPPPPPPQPIPTPLSPHTLTTASLPLRVVWLGEFQAQECKPESG